MEQTSPELASALLQWVNSFKLSTSPQSWKELADGDLIWGILNDIDPEYFTGSLPELDRKSTDNWIPRWQNWKHIEKEVLQYIREECERLQNSGRKLNADLKGIATAGSIPDIQKMTKCVLLASMYSDKSNERMIDVMSSLGPRVMDPFMAFLRDIEELDESLADIGDTEPSSEVDYSTDGEFQPDKEATFERDPELEREERLIQALQEKKRVDAMLADTIAELEESKSKIKSLEDEVEENRYTLDRRRSKSFDDKNLAQMTQRADQDRQYIEELETDLASAKTTIDAQERHLDRLKADAASKQDLRDEITLITADRDDLKQKSKANENLRKKIQTLQEQEKASSVLRADLQHAQEQLLEFDVLRERCSALEKANDENAQTIANGEQEIFDQKTAKRMLEYELKTISQKWEQTKELLGNAQEIIKDLEERLQESNPSQDEEGRAENLDDELSEAPEDAANKAREAKRKSTQPVVTADSIVLQQKLNIAAGSVERLEKRCLDLLQENLGFKAIIDDTVEANNKDLRPFQHQALKLEELGKELDEAKSKFITASSQITDLQQRLDSAQGKSSSTAIQLQINQERQRYITDLEQTLRDQRNLLRHALLSSEALQKEEATLRATNEFKLIKLQLEIVNATPTTEAQSIIKSSATGLTDRIESVRGALAVKERILEDREKEFVSLQKEMEGFKMRPPPVPPKDAPSEKELEKQLSQLQRENKLIASAWYDITSRLQSNTVHLARRAEGGRSWLSKMRVSINTTSGTTGQTRRI